MVAEKEAVIVDVVIDAPRLEYNRYVYDYEAKAVRLAEVVYPSHRYPVDLGAVPDTLAPDGRPVGVLLIVNQATFPGCVVAARPIGLAEYHTADGLQSSVVAVAEADSYFTEVRDIGDLPPHRVKEIEAWLESGPAGEPAMVVWRGAEEARRFVHKALQARRLAQRETDRSRQTRPAWQAAFGPGQIGQGSRETIASTEAEQAVCGLPYRFQNYVAQCLAPEERILLHVLRPPLTYGRLPWLHRRQTNEGILVITDQQLLFMVDVLAPDSTYVQWGYLVRASALERVRSAEVIQAKPHIRLAVELEAAGGVERLNFDFPTSALPELERAASILRAFAPRTGEQWLRRVPDVVDERPSLDAEEDELGPPELVERLEKRAREHLSDGERILSVALAPAWPERRLGPRLVALTKERLLMVPEEDGGFEAYSLGEISSIKLHNSLLGYHMELAVPRMESMRRIVVDFDSPSARRFTRLFRATRQLLAAPVY